MSVDAELVQGIRECIESLRKMTEILGVCSRELDEATRKMASLAWKVEPLQVCLADAAKMLSLSPAHVRGLVTKGELDATGKVRSLRITVESIHAYMARQARENNPTASRIFDSPFGEKARSRRARMRYGDFKKAEPKTSSDDYGFGHDGPFKCPECGRGFDTERGLKSHKNHPGIFHKTRGSGPNGKPGGLF